MDQNLIDSDQAGFINWMVDHMTPESKKFTLELFGRPAQADGFALESYRMMFIDLSDGGENLTINLKK